MVVDLLGLARPGDGVGQDGAQVVQSEHVARAAPGAGQWVRGLRGDLIPDPCEPAGHGSDPCREEARAAEQAHEPVPSSPRDTHPARPVGAPKF